MPRLRTLVTISVCGALTANNAIAGGPFSNTNKFGDLFLVMTAAYALGMSSTEDNFDGTIELGASILSAQLAAEGIKALELEERPNGSDRKSLPSGHAAGAFSSAMFVHKRYGWKPAIIPYAMATITGWSRVQADAHYWHDVLAGAAISALFTWAIVDKYDPNQNVTLSTSSDNVRIGFQTTF